MSSEDAGLVSGDFAPTAFALFLAQALVIVLASRLTAALLAPARLPAVVGEMMAGILLGPTALGRAPHFSAALFPPASLPALSAASTRQIFPPAKGG